MAVSYTHLDVYKRQVRQSSGDVTFTAAKVTGLTGDALSAIGTSPAYDLNIS